MYAKKVQLKNYGPVEKLNIEFPFEDVSPKPVLLVGENGSGKSILLSHIVNGLVSAKGVVYPETPEVETGKVYKLRSSGYIKSGSEYYFGRVEFEDGMFISELRLRRRKREYEAAPPELSEPTIEAAWNMMNPEDSDHFDSSFSPNNKAKVEGLFAKNSVLYFPPNRFEEPAWLNEENLKARAQYMDLKHLEGYTERKVINYSPLRENQNWLFGLLYDRAVFEIQTPSINMPVRDSNTTVPLPVFAGYSGIATGTYEVALQIVRSVVRREDARFGVGLRNDRRISIESGLGQLIPNIFQLSSGETALLNLFLSILRDFELSGVDFSSASDVTGIAVIDEIDLHLHAVHQHEILPNLIKMFPKIQFVVTTHSPLFVLGMQRVFGEDGFALYRLPQGHQIRPEEFSEFGDAYQAFAETVRFSDDLRAAIEGAQKPIVYVEGVTGENYVRRASQLLGQEAILQGVEVRDGGGVGDMKKIWKSWLSDLIPHKVMLLFDCDVQLGSDDKKNLFRRIIPLQSNNPVQKGIENLFSKETLERARQHKPAFVDIDPQHTRIVRGKPQLVAEKWSINEYEKTNLCEWLCENGTIEDFRHFQLIFDLIEEGLELTPSSPITVESDTIQ